MTAALALLTNAEMAEADRRAVAAGMPSLTLMENAGRAVADEAMRMLPAGGRTAVLCGPGNNGGDGFVAARYLVARGYDVALGLPGAREALKADAATMAARWSGPVVALADVDCRSADLVIDAIYGAGISRPIDGEPAAAIAAANGSGRPILAVDVPSGLDGSTGLVRGEVVIGARRTITFFRRKPGHLLLPGRLHCGEVVVADIGMPPSVLEGCGLTGVPLGSVSANAPGLWRDVLPRPAADHHKYSRGHAVVVSGPPECTGAARLGARGALRMGSGLVTLASSRAAFPVNAAQLTAVMIEPFEVPAGLARVLADRRRNAVLVGPGAGVSSSTAEMVRLALASGAATVLDADALTSFAGEPGGDRAIVPSFGFLGPGARGAPAAPEDLFAAIRSAPLRPVVLTPHEGEYRRLFGAADAGASKLDRARHAAALSGAAIVLKGADTVIAAPDGRAAINENAPPWLATAGSGDVLSGFVTGLLAQGMPTFEAAAAAVWLHGACATAFGSGLIAEDLPEALPRVLAQVVPGP
jgi:NAD(P)H-hydrate epimerase